MPGTVLYQARFQDGLPDWKLKADWQPLSSTLVNDGTGQFGLTAVAPLSTQVRDYAVEAEVQLVRIVTKGASFFGYQTGAFGFGVFARGGYFAGFCAAAGYGGGPTCPGDISGPQYISIGKSDQSALVSDHYDLQTSKHVVRLEVRGNQQIFFLDGREVLRSADNTFLAPGSVGVWCTGAQIVVYSFKVTAL